MILIAILLPSLGRARLTATELSCTARLRELGNLVAVYAGEHDDLIPAAISADAARDPARWREYTFQVFSTFPREPWLSWSGLGPHSEILYCPSNQHLDDLPDDVSDPDFVLSASVFAEVSYFNPALPDALWRARLGAKVQTLGAATFASSKVGILELDVWHGWSGVACEGCPIDGLEYYQSERPGSVWFIDGHVDQVRADAALPHVYRYPTWPVMPFGTTEFGMAGRDIQ